MTIRKKLYLMLIFVLLVMAGMASAAYVRGRSVIIDLIDSAGASTVKASAMAIDKRFDISISALDTCAEIIQQNWLRKNVKEEQEIELLLKGLLPVVQTHGVNDVIFGFESTGKLSDASGWREPEDYDARTRSWYRKAVEYKGKVAISDPYIDMEIKKTTLALSRALYDDSGKLLGVVAGDILLDELNDYVRNIQILDRGYGFLLLKDGLVFAGTRSEDILKTNLVADSRIPESLGNVARRMIHGDTGIQEYTYGGNRLRAFFVPTKTGFFLAVAFPMSELQARVNSLTALLAFIAAVAFAVMGLVIVLLNRGLTRGIHGIQDATEILGTGDLTVRYDDSGHDEFARISKTLNSMVSSISEVMRGIVFEADQAARQAETLAALSEETLASVEELAKSAKRVNAIVENASVKEIVQGTQPSAQSMTDDAKQAAESIAKASQEMVDTSKKLRDLANTFTIYEKRAKPRARHAGGK